MTNRKLNSVGETIVRYLEERDVSVVFGIPGVHTVELYRGLAQSGIRHVTARHEQGAGFMADGYSRVSGKVGVAFIITGPGMTNILTPMIQARADSIPMLIISSVNEEETLARGLGHLHEMPDQKGVCDLIACRSEHVSSPRQLIPALDAVYEHLESKRPGPVHVQIPLDVMGAPFNGGLKISVIQSPKLSPDEKFGEAATLLSSASKPVILAGGGARTAEAELVKVAEQLSAPVVQTINARGLMHDHPLKVPASPSLKTIRDLIRKSDAILAVGTELGPTDFDVNRDSNMPEFRNMVRIDIDQKQLDRHEVEIGLCSDAKQALSALSAKMHGNKHPERNWGEKQATQARVDARAELSETYKHMISMLETIRDTLPGSIIVGDSTQPIYAGNTFYSHDSPDGWFNSSVGFGSLGYAIPASIGAALAAPERPVVCVTGDGGAQFTLPEFMVAVDEKLPVTFIIWNNRGFQEIETSMASAGVEVVGCDPTPPDFQHLAKAYCMDYQRCENATDGLIKALKAAQRHEGPRLIEIVA